MERQVRIVQRELDANGFLREGPPSICVEGPSIGTLSLHAEKPSSDDYDGLHYYLEDR
jgi:hypothetical protein